jgi:hypothetical protein
VNPRRAPKTKRMHVMTQAEMEVRPSTFGELVVMLVSVSLIHLDRKLGSKLKCGRIQVVFVAFLVPFSPLHPFVHN